MHLKKLLIFSHHSIRTIALCSNNTVFVGVNSGPFSFYFILVPYILGAFYSRLHVVYVIYKGLPVSRLNESNPASKQYCTLPFC